MTSYRIYFFKVIILAISSLFLANTVFSANSRKFVVVIDAGHGGKDAGTCHNGGREKDINLNVALLLGKFIRTNYPEVKVLYTRQTDVFVGLQQRADFANRNNANLFISIHVNSAPAKGVSGTETYVLGIGKQDNNLSVAMRENKAMLLEGDYKTVYKGFDPTSAESYIMFQVMQNAYLNKSIDFATLVQQQYKRANRYSRGVRQDILWVLSQSAMPAVLTELGFLTNKEEARYLMSSKGQQELANAIGRAFGIYYLKKDFSDKMTVEQETEEVYAEDDVPTIEQETVREDVSDDRSESKTAKVSGVAYTIKFMSVKELYDVNDKKFKNLKEKVTRQKYGKYYIYYVGKYNSYSEAQKSLARVKKYYKDAVLKKL